jgi:hypothetical protein
MPTIAIALACLGSAGIVAGSFARRATGEFSTHGPAPNKWRMLHLTALVIGIMIGIASWPLTYWMAYPIDTRETTGYIVGFPFFVAFFDSAGRDYIGPLTMPGVVANAFFGA